MVGTTSAEVAIGELRARVEFETVTDGASASLRPKRIQLVVVPKADEIVGRPFGEIVVLGEIVEAP